MTAPRVLRARFGVRWWDRGSHASFFDDDPARTVYTVGMDGRWPKPCRECVDLLEEDR